MEKFNIAIFGADPQAVHPDILKIGSVIDHQVYDLDLMIEPLQSSPNIILCYPPKDQDGISSLEIAQSLRNTYPNISLFFISLDRKTFDKKRLIKNGFTQAFILPWEKSDLLRAMQQEALCTLVPELRDYKAIKVADLLPGVVLDFSLKVYLPKSNKLLHFSHGGDPISEDKFKKLQETNMNSLFIKKDEIEKFREYTADLFKKMIKTGSISETDKQDKLEHCVRDLISDMFIEDTKENTFGASQTLLTEVKDIIDILIEDSDKDLAAKVNNLINQEQNFYLHLSNVSTYAGLFAMIFGLPNPAEVALAGILHDIGKINLPPEIGEREKDQLTPEEFNDYKEHPNFSIDIVKLRRIALPAASIQAILQHHEAVNGSGFPKGLNGPKICIEAKVLAIANTFDNLTSIKPGRLSFTPRAALLHMIEENTKNMILDLDMLLKLKKVFLT